MGAVGADQELARLAQLSAVDVDTPALLVDGAALERNIAAMATFAEGWRVGLRPHAKTHKSADIARLQLVRGAVGLCCAKLGEAEALTAAGVGPLLITSPVVGRHKLARLQRLVALAPDLMLVVDQSDAVRTLAEAVPAPVDVLVDLDPGMQRTGVRSVADAIALAGAVEASGRLRFRGVQAYAGSIQHLADAERRAAAALEVTTWLAQAVAALGAAGFACPVVTGSGTGTFAVDATAGVFTDLQVGSYVFIDDEYAANAPLSPDAPAFERSAFLLAQVVSANHQGLATIDAGSKSLSFDGPLPAVQWPPGLNYERAGDEFGKVVIAADQAPEVGDRVLLGLPHCDPTINLHDAYLCVRDGEVVDRWPVTARGRSD